MIHQNITLYARYRNLVVHSSDETIRFGAFNNPVSNIDPTLHRCDMKGNKRIRRVKDEDETWYACMYVCLWNKAKKRLGYGRNVQFPCKINWSRISCTFSCPKWLVAKISVGSIRNDTR